MSGQATRIGGRTAGLSRASLGVEVGGPAGENAGILGSGGGHVTRQPGAENASDLAGFGDEFW
jgi:hypothetical protein